MFSHLSSIAVAQSQVSLQPFASQFLTNALKNSDDDS